MGTFGPTLWNSLPYHIKCLENLSPLKGQLSIGMENVASVTFVIAVNKLIFRFNVGRLFLLTLL